MLYLAYPMISPDYIKNLRQKAGYSQAYLAAELGISRPTYVQVELGERELTVSEAQKLAGIFGIGINDFISGNAPQIAPRVTIEQVGKSLEPDLEIRVTSKNLNKFKQVLLYVLEKVGAKPNVGETVLYKLLYFIDFDYYEKYEENLMGATYIKNHHGPTPIEFKEIVADMKKKGELTEVKNKYFAYKQKKYLPRVRPDLSVLSGRDIEHIDEVLARLSDKNASELSEYSHHDIPYLTRAFGQPLSYESVFYRDDKYSVRTYDDELWWDARLQAWI